ncbi:MAG: histidine kinase [Thermoanaerobaculia bacterium]
MVTTPPSAPRLSAGARPLPHPPPESASAAHLSPPQQPASRRLGVALAASVLVGLALTPVWKLGPISVIGRSTVIGLFALLVFGLLERRPKRPPRWFARWTLQVVGVALAVPAATLTLSVLTSQAGGPPFWKIPDRLSGFVHLTIAGLLVAPWIAMVAVLRTISGAARNQKLAFELERSELERRALDGRLRLLEAQVEPHFLFNTLANVRELVETGSPRASPVLGSLISYLRAAVPTLRERPATFARELELVRSYLEIMQMRMPDRMTFEVRVDDVALPLYCPPMTLSTLVENAVRHGIDPSEEGGRIEVRVEVSGDRCRVEVVDTGIGLSRAKGESGTGLANLTERLRLAFRDDARLRLVPLQPHGVRAEVTFPAVRGEE